MNATEFRSSAIIACEKYYKYLSENHGGSSITHVVDFYLLPNSLTDFSCQLNQKLMQLDSCEVFVNDAPTKSVSILKYFKEANSHYVILRVQKNPALFADLDPSDITIRSDLRFLIKRLCAFYRESDLNFTPTVSFTPPSHNYPVSVVPSSEQSSAIDGVLSSGVSYVCGPPGTGKTKIVLSECILRYIHAGKRVVLLAPTNNAVEQMLRGILPTLRTAGIDLHCVYRLGIATASFAKDFPEVVGSSELEAERSALLDRKSQLESELSSSITHKNNVQKNREHISFLLGLKCCIKHYFDVSNLIKELEEALKSNDESIADISSRKSKCQQDCAAAERSLDKCRYEIKSLKKQRIMCCVFFWRSYHLDRIESSLLSLQSKEEEILHRISELHTSLQNISAEEDSARAKHSDIVKHISELSSDQTSLVASVLETPNIPDDIRLVFRSLSGITFDKAISDFCIPFDELSLSYAKYAAEPHRSIESISSDLQEVSASLNETSGNNKLRQLDNSLVLSGTIHSALKWLSLPREKPVSHIFLDEAGYTSIVYGAAPFSCGCPVTFFGDHFQLAPICEMSHIDKSNEEVCLFSLPCAYYSEITDLSMDSLFELYSDMSQKGHGHDVSPSFSSLPIFLLSKSYRFSDSLASVLSSCLYPSRFFGVSDSSFEIIILDAENPSGKPSNNTSPYEARAIYEYLLRNSSSLCKSVAILAPYRNQQKLLFKSLSSFKYDVLTIHRSQGMEYETIILSVVDKADAFFMNSDIPYGRRVLNTALSRAKMRLVIACDVRFWRDQSGQLLSALISLGTLYSPSPAQIPASAPEPPAASAPAAAENPAQTVF